MKLYYITVYPYATQYGTIEVPEKITDKSEINQYINEHFDEIEFGEPDLDYRGVDFEFEEGEDD